MILSPDESGSGEERYRFVGPDQTDAEAFFTGVLNSLYEHIAVVENDGSIIAVNEAWRSFARQNDAKSAYAVSEGANYLDVCSDVTDGDSEYAQAAIKGMRDVIEGRETIFSMEYPCSSPTEERWFLMTVVPLQRPEGGAVVTHTNITRRLLAERDLLESREEYRDMTRKLLTAREDASRRLARELHDSFSQRLAMISMFAAKIEINCGGEKNAEGLNRIQDEMTKLSGDVHDISKQLHPSIIEELGLSDAVASFCRSFADNEGIAVEFDPADNAPDLGRETALNLYRIVQESMNNAAKHSGTGKISVGLETSDGVLRVSVRDEGSGFDIDEARKKRRLGLVSLRERAALIGGKIEIESSPGSGTAVTVEVPLGNGTPVDRGDDNG
jgi:signal transduction histidine kinase